MCPPTTLQAYNEALENGALGGKLIGAGGGGFLMFIASDKIQLRHVMKKYNYNELKFSFDFLGARILSYL